MHEWSREPLVNVAEIRASNVDKKSNRGEQPVRLCNYMDVYAHDYITEDMPFMDATATAAEIQRFRVDRGDVLITKDSETPDDIGVSSVVLDDIKDLVCGYHVALLKPRRDRMDPVYLAKQLASSETARYFGRLANGSTRYGLSYKSIAATPIRVAPLSEQQRIAEILATIDDAIEQTEALIAKTDHIKAGLMHDLFTRGVNRNGELRRPRSEATDLYRESSLGWIPKEWERKPLRTVATYQHGRPFPSSEYSDEGVLLLRPGNLHASGFVQFDKTHTTRLPSIWLNASPGYVLRLGDIVMNLTAQSLDDEFLGRVCLNEARESALLNQRIARFSPIEIDRTFLYWLLRSRQFRIQIDRTTQGTKVQHLYNRDIDRVVFEVPHGCEEQEAIASRLGTATDAIRQEEASLQKIKHLKAGLMQDLLTGRVRASTPDARGVRANV